MEQKIYTATIVSESRPYLIKEGNSWIADAVYVNKDNEYITRKVLAPNLQHGPFEIGEKIEIEPDINDVLADEYQIRIYENPDLYKSIMLDKKRKKEGYQPIVKKEKKSKGLNLIISILVLGIFLFVFYLLLSSTGAIPKLF